MNEMRIASNLLNIPAPAKFKILQFVLVMIFLPLFSQFAAAQQEEKPPEDLVPPPLVLLSKDEKSRLEAETDAHKRTDVAIELIEGRMAKAEKLTDEKKFTESLDELGGFQAIINNQIKFLERNQTSSKNIRGFKALEISLRSFTARLEIIRREMPLNYAYHVRTLMKFVREARTRSSDKLFDNTVLPQGS